MPSIKTRKEDTERKVYKFKHNYDTFLKNSNTFETDRHIYTNEDGLIPHDLDTVAERYITRSEVYGDQGAKELKRLQKVCAPIPSSYPLK